MYLTNDEIDLIYSLLEHFPEGEEHPGAETLRAKVSENVQNRRFGKKGQDLLKFLAQMSPEERAELISEYS